MNETIIAALLLAGFLGLPAFVVFLVIRQGRKEKQDRRALAEALGFRPLETVPASLSERIIALHRRARGQQFAVRNVFSRTTQEGEFYLYDLWETGGESSSRVEHFALAVVAPGVSLPRFTILPRLDTPGNLSALANRLMICVVKQFAPEIVFDAPEFQAHYILNGEDEPAIRALVAPDLLDYLGRSPSLGVRVGGDTFTVSRLVLHGVQKKPDLESVGELYNHTIRLAGYLLG